MLQPLPQIEFFPSAERVAPRLLGHWLIRNTSEGPMGGLIVETEAYITNDPACHAFRGETARNRSMWGPPGHAYVYLIYGYHYCVNVVCRPQGHGEAVLIRALEPATGQSLMRRFRPVQQERDLTNGPAKLCAALDINRQLDGINLCDATSPLFLATNPERNRFIKKHGPIQRGPRIGISKAADWPLRYFLAQSPFVSRARTRPMNINPSSFE